jgi:hypothetical protein
MTQTSRAIGVSLCLLYATMAGVLCASDAASPSAPHPAILLDQLGAEAQKHYAGEGISISPTAKGAQVRSVLQDLEGEASPDGLWLTSNADEDAGKVNRFRVRAVEFGRASSFSSALAATGSVHVMKDCAAYARPGLIEEYRVGTDGVRQDFVVLQRPAGGAGPLSVILDVAGARAAAAGYGAKLTVDGTGRELAYSRLAVSDARGKRLTARLIVEAADRLRIEVEDAEAVYPVRIDPTFSDVDWISMGAGLQGINGDVFALTTDAAGNLYVGGSFTRVGDAPAGGVAMWTGSAWSNLTGGMNGTVKALAIVGGNLYAGGSFVASGGYTFNRIAKWNGTVWSDLGAGMDGDVNAFAVIGSDLYVGGAFTSAGGILANRVARWNGAWNQVNFQALNGPVSALAVMGTDLYAGGSFTSAGGNPASAIAKWNGTAWSALPSEITNGAVNALQVIGTDLYAGGTFLNAGGASANRVAKWNGTAWSPLADGLNGTVYALAELNGNLIVGGLFSGAGGIPSAGNVVRWNGTAWSGLEGGPPNGEVRALTVLSGTDLYVGGVFTSIGGVRTRKLARWTGTTWWEVGHGLSDTVHALAVSGSDIYLGGAFKAVNGLLVNHVVKWDGADWHPLDTGVDGTVRTLAVSGSDVYAGGDFANAGGAPANRIAKWNGAAWSALGDGADDTVKCLAISGTDLYAGGEFVTAGGVTCNGIAKWNGTIWSSLGTGMAGGASAVVHALAIAGSNVYAGGSFASAGGVTAANIATWNGSAWVALGSGMNNSVHALAISGSTVYAGGDFTTAGGVNATRMARWNGSGWSPVGTGSFTNHASNATVRAMAVSGANLYVAGDFTFIGNVGVRGVARLSGNTWSGLGDLNTGLNAPAYALALINGDVYAGGAFSAAGGALASGFATWDGAGWSILSRTSDGIVSAMTIHGTDLYVGGTFTVMGGVQMGAGGLTTGNVARWNGSRWSYVGGGTILSTGVDGPVTALASYNGDLYAAGSFMNAGSVSARRIAKWDGTNWSALSTGLNAQANALAVFGGHLFVGGQFTTAGGGQSMFIARWNGTAWILGAPGMFGAVHCLAATDTHLYAGGEFPAAGIVPANRIARFDGNSWGPVGAGVTSAGSGTAVYALAAFGGNVYAAGAFSSMGGTVSTNIARWNGTSWNAMGPGFPQAVRTLAVSGPNVYAGGEFRHTSGGLLVNGIAHWDGTSWHDMGSGMDDTVLCLLVNDSTLYAGGHFQYAGGEMSAYLARAAISGVYPVVTLGSATGVTATSATMHGTVNPNGAVTSALFEYGPSISYGSTAAVTLSPNNGATAQAVSAPVSGLTPGTQYHYRLRAFGVDGAASTTVGTFDTPSNNANLSALSIPNCTINPGFSASQTFYTGSATSIALVVRPTVAHSAATVTVNGTNVPSGTDSAPISIPFPANTQITIVVTAEDGTTKTYTLMVNRGLIHGSMAIDLPAGSTLWVKETDGVVQIPIRRSNGFDWPIGCDIATTDGSARAGSDYTTPTSPFMMGDQQATGFAEVAIRNPANTNEGNESFTVTLANPFGGATLAGTQSVTVMIFDGADTARPSPPVFTDPATENGLVNCFPLSSLKFITGTAADNKNIVKVEFSANGAPFVEIPFDSYAGKTVSWTREIVPTSSQNILRVRSTDASGNVSPIATRTFRVATPLSVNVDESAGSVTDGFSGSTWKEINRSYTITATPKTTPAPGYIFDSWVIDSAQAPVDIGTTTSGLQKPTLTFIHTGAEQSQDGHPLGSLDLRPIFIANPYDSSVTGTYNGLIKASPNEPVRNGDPGSVPGLGTEGYFTASVMGTGAFSGRLTIDGLVLNVAGVFDAQGKARFGTARALTLNVARANKPSLVVQLDIGGPSGSAVPTGSLRGKVTALEFRGSTPASVSDVTAERAHFTGLAGFVVPDEYLTVTGTATSPIGRTDGMFTVALPSIPWSSQPQRIKDALQELDYPKGDGVGTIKVTKAGSVTLIATLADGTPVTASSTLSQGLRVALFAQLYTQKGFLSAPILLDHTLADSDLTTVPGTAVLWSRPFNSAVHYYPYGWAETLELDLLGARYLIPAGQSVLRAANNTSLPAAGEDGNVTLSFTGGQLSVQQLVKSVNLTSTPVDPELVTRVPENDPTFTMKVNRAAGAITGVFDHTDDTRPAYNAIILQKGPNAGARGFFLTKQPTPIDYTGESGKVTIQSAP